MQLPKSALAQRKLSTWLLNMLVIIILIFSMIDIPASKPSIPSSQLIAFTTPPIHKKVIINESGAGKINFSKDKPSQFISNWFIPNPPIQIKNDEANCKNNFIGAEIEKISSNNPIKKNNSDGIKSIEKNWLLIISKLLDLNIKLLMKIDDIDPMSIPNPPILTTGFVCFFLLFGTSVSFAYNPNSLIFGRVKKVIKNEIKIIKDI